MPRFDANIPQDVAQELARLPLQRVDTVEDLRAITFTRGLAALMVCSSILPRIAFKNDQRTGSLRVDALAERIADYGYQPRDPIICRIGRRGKWVVIDGGHRLTAIARQQDIGWRGLARRLLRWLGLAAPAWLARRLQPPHFDVYFILFTSERRLELAARDPLPPA